MVDRDRVRLTSFGHVKVIGSTIDDVLVLFYSTKSSFSLGQGAVSVEVHVFFRGKLPAASALARSLRSRGFALRFAAGTGSLERHEGFLPMSWSGDETGFEFEVVSDPAELEECRVAELDPALDRCAVFRLGGDMTGLFAAQAVAAALAELTGGTVYDPEEGRVLALDAALANARSTLALITASRTRQPRRTRPADIRHYLKPLLSERKDMILRGRHLFIRGARHFLRGALFAPTGDAFELSVVAYATRLYLPLDDSDGGLHGRSMHVWQPYFEPWLFNVLRHDVFEILAEINGVIDLADYGVRTYRERKSGHMTHCVLEYLLAGERDRAEALVLEFERTWQPWWAERYRALFERDIEALCQECHRNEAEAAQALKLGDMWEPAPFPVEVPEARRRQSTDEAPFAATPWLARAEDVVRSPPDAPGEVAFACKYTWRHGEPILVGPLTRDEAQVKYDNDENHCLFTRMPGGELLMLSRYHGWAPEDPRRGLRPRWKNYELLLQAPSRRLFADFSGTFAEPGMMYLGGVSVRMFNGREIWSVGFSFSQDYWWTGADRKSHPITERERSLCAVAPPRFGEYAELLARANDMLENCGQGRFTA